MPIARANLRFRTSKLLKMLPRFDATLRVSQPANWE